MGEVATKATTEVAKNGLAGVKAQLAHPAVMESFQKLLGKNASGFTSALISIVGNNDKFKDVDARSVILAAGQSAAMNMPINPSLGMAYVIPYGKVAQFQIGRDGLIELCLRSGIIATITNEVVYEGELVNADRFKGEYEFDSSKRISDKVIGFMAYARTTAGFEKTLYMSREEVMAHGQRYSKNFNYGLWKSDPEKMGLKTVLKMLIKKWLPKSVEMQKALSSDNMTFTQGEVGDAQPQYMEDVQAEKPTEVVDVDAQVVEEAE